MQKRPAKTTDRFQRLKDEKLNLAILFPHPLTGSLGSFRRVKQIALSLSTKVNARVFIYTPYEQSESVLAKNVSVKPIPNLLSLFGLSDIAYSLSKELYYNRSFCRGFLFRSIGLSGSLVRKLCELLNKDGISAIQAEHDVTIPLALQLGDRLRVPVVADLHNISAEELVAASILENGDETYRELQSRMKEWLSRLDFVCVVSEEMQEYVKSEYHISGNKILVVPPGGRITRCKYVANPHGKVVYMGTVSYREHVDLYVRSIPSIRETTSEVEFYATRKGEDLNRVKKLCRKLDLPMNWFWFPSEEDLFRFLCECSVGVLPSTNDKARIMGTPIKLFDYMSVGLPIVANDVGGWSRMIEEEGIGLLTEDSPADFGSAVAELLGDKDLRMKMSSNALDAIKNKYNWDKMVEPLASIYNKLL